MSISISPNSDTSYVNLNFSSTIPVRTIRIINALGQEIANIPVSGMMIGRSMSYDVSSFASGIYFVQLLNNEGVITTERLVIN